MSEADSIKSCAIFSELDASKAAELQRISNRRKFAACEIIFSEGDEATALYILVSGSVDLVKSSSGGKEQLVRRVKKGEMFAEAAMFSGDAYPVTATATIASETVSINKARFLSFVRTHPDVALKIMGSMAKLLRHLNRLLSDISLSSVAGRLAVYLIARSREEGSFAFEIGLPKKELAFRLGTIPATLSRNLRALMDKGVIAVRGNQVVVKKMKSLEEIAGG